MYVIASTETINRHPGKVASGPRLQEEVYTFFETSPLPSLLKRNVHPRYATFSLQKSHDLAKIR